jgi:hypothetical protein
MLLPARPAVIITWPSRPKGCWQFTVHDAATGRDYSPVTLTATVTVSPVGAMQAELLMITDANGDPQTNDGPTLLTDDGTDYRRATFTFDVAENHVRDTE